MSVNYRIATPAMPGNRSGLGQRRDRQVETLQRLVNGERCGLEPGLPVGLVSGLALGVDEHPQELLREPALGPCSRADLGCEATDAGQLGGEFFMAADRTLPTVGVLAPWRIAAGRMHGNL